jgi:hypothetical protein
LFEGTYLSEKLILVDISFMNTEHWVMERIFRPALAALLLIPASLSTGCREEPIPATVERRAIQECENAAAESSPHHDPPTLGDPTVRRLKDDHYSVRATLIEQGGRKYFECQLSDETGVMEVLGLSVVHR